MERYFKLAALATVPVVGVFVCILLFQVSAVVDEQGKQAKAAINKITNESSRALEGINTALNTINAPCTDNGHQYVCGTLANVNQTTKNVGILAAQGAEQVKLSGALIQATTRNLDAAGQGVTKLTDSLAKVGDTTNDAVGTLASHAATTLDTANATIGAAKPVLASANVFMGHADLFMGSLSPTVQNVDRMTGDWASMSDDAKTKFHLILFPPPCKTFGCRAARVYPYVKGVAELGEASYWTKQLLAP